MRFWPIEARGFGPPNTPRRGNRAPAPHWGAVPPIRTARRVRGAYPTELYKALSGAGNPTALAVRA